MKKNKTFETNYNFDETLIKFQNLSTSLDKISCNVRYDLASGTNNFSDYGYYTKYKICKGIKLNDNCRYCGEICNCEE